MSSDSDAAVLLQLMTPSDAEDAEDAVGGPVAAGMHIPVLAITVEAALQYRSCLALVGRLARAVCSPWTFSSAV